MTEWEKAQEWEANWHSNCINSFHEEEKQLVYAEKMGLIRTPTPKTPYNFDLKGVSVLDIGGGAYSLLLKCMNFGRAVVVDPLMDKYPSWVVDRYMSAKIVPIKMSGENLLEKHSLLSNDVFEEIWIYNVLEHTYNPEKIIKNALELSKVVRIFEWIDTYPNIGHPQVLTEALLNKWLGGEGKIGTVNHDGAAGKFYSGVFKGNFYEKI